MKPTTFRERIEAFKTKVDWVVSPKLVFCDGDSVELTQLAWVGNISIYACSDGAMHFVLAKGRPIEDLEEAIAFLKGAEL